MSEIILSNEQISVARYPENGVIRVNGGPGSGKTLVAVKRAIFLAKEYKYAEKDDRRERISDRERDIYSSSEANILRTDGRDLQNDTDGREVSGASSKFGGRRNRFEQAQLLGTGENEISGTRESGIFEKSSNERRSYGTSAFNSEGSRKILGDRKTQNDENYGINRKIKRKRSNRMGRTYEQPTLFSQGNNLQSDNLQIENNNIITQKNIDDVLKS